MAARAYDLGVICLKGHTADINFPEDVSSLSMPASLSPRDIQIAASAAAAAWQHRQESLCAPRFSKFEMEHQSEIDFAVPSVTESKTNEGALSGNCNSCYDTEMVEDMECSLIVELQTSREPLTRSDIDDSSFGHQAVIERELEEKMNPFNLHLYCEMAEAMLLPPPLLSLPPSPDTEAACIWNLWTWGDHHPR
ncbi:hypothetical protein KP509_13G084900 [Ceratopteris richardii]|uniref:AP2/ERF domain-containing protein n=1 Tax=Ceratopteris richardii TaxID=49495 RepID=A0A8T2TJJ1_CERRI|nr:hypothetical protein KP509_13G084900 [Ceratopteris richardii]